MLRLLQIAWLLVAGLGYGIGLSPTAFSLVLVPPWTVALMMPLNLFIGLVFLLIYCRFMRYFLPDLQCGTFSHERKGAVLTWMLHAGVHNLIRVPRLNRWVWTNPVHRAFYCWAFSMKVHNTAVLSLQADIIDPFFVEIDAGAKIGEWAKLSGHFSDKQGFHFGRITIGRNAQIGADVLLPPGVVVGETAVIQARSTLLPNTVVRPGDHWSGTPARPMKQVAES